MKPSDISARLRQERQRAVQERRAQEAAWEPRRPFAPRRRGPEPPPKAIGALEGLPARLRGIVKPLRPVGARPPAPNCCRRDAKSWQTSLTHVLCTSEVPGALHAAYAAWAEHHEMCETCSQEDWAVPGDVRTVEDPLMADGQVTLNGKVVYFRRTHDLSVLCPDGRDLFQQWCSAAAIHRTVGL